MKKMLILAPILIPIQLLVESGGSLNTMCALLAFAACFTLYIKWLVKFYCDIITRSRLQLIKTLIDTFFSKLLCLFNGTKGKGRLMIAKKKLDGAVDESSPG